MSRKIRSNVWIPLLVSVLLGAATLEVPSRIVLNPVQIVSNDSIGLRLQWTEVVPLPRTSPLVGYEWAFDWTLVRDSLFADSLFRTGSIGEDVDRDIYVVAPASCGDSIFYQARVRPLGEWDSEAEWGYSPVVGFYCANAPPPPPNIDLILDTLPEFPMDEWPVDSINARLGDFYLDVEPVLQGPNSTWTFSAEDGSSTLYMEGGVSTSAICAFVKRGGIKYKALREYTHINMWDLTELGERISPSQETLDNISLTPVPGLYACEYVTVLSVSMNTFLAL